MPGHWRGLGRPASEGARDDRRHRLPDPRHLSDGRMPGEIVGFSGGGDPAAIARRAYRRLAGRIVRRRSRRGEAASRKRRRVIGLLNSPRRHEGHRGFYILIPAKAGIHLSTVPGAAPWVPAFAGTTTS